MRTPDAARSHYLLTAALLLGGAVTACDGGAPLQLSTQAVDDTGTTGATGSTALPLPAPVIGPAEQRDAALTAFLEQRQVVERPSHRDAAVDLDGDGTDDLLVLLEDPNWCSDGGCTLLVFRNEGDAGYRLVTETRFTHAPIALGPQRHAGWHDLLVGVGGDGTQAGTVALQFDGERYPANPTLLALLADGRVSRARPLIE